MEESSHKNNSSEPGYEKRDISVARVTIYGIVGVVIVIIVIIFGVDYFTAVTERAVEEAVLKPQSVPMRELRAREIEELTTYAVLDSAQGVYRIPIERAMELVADEAYQERTAPGRGK
jgi:hypothetical protein